MNGLIAYNEQVEQLSCGLPRHTMTLDVTVGRRTHPVEFSHYGKGRAHSVDRPFIARTFHGTKTHRANMSANQNPDGTWRVGTRVTVLNTQATIIGWCEDYAPTSKHLSTR